MATQPHKPTKQRIIALGLALATLSVIWGVVLPWLATVDVIQRDIARTEAAGIDPSALYWTDLDRDDLWERSP